ncbi:MAG TPA: asparagine synthase (glutamine-hydrolyzing) [Chitinophagaceae bacterium]|nr:asparagine synthase (glutamine-hydrolyzing) [Chitinophagaceae bacterium]
MCGIAGIIEAGPGPREGAGGLSGLIRDMTIILQHRGPDGKSDWVDESAGLALGHCRLAILDRSDSARQPMPYLDRYHIVHNGEVYNYLELRRDLENQGYRFRTRTDTEVIAAAFDRHRERCVEYFDGMFAFAVWDARTRTLFAARDRFGEKPFFFCLGETRFLFASEMKALWAAGIPRDPNLNMLFNFLTIGYADNPLSPQETFFNRISKLPAATRLTYSPDSHALSLEKYWDIDLNNRREDLTADQAVGTFRQLLHESVRIRLRSDVPLGCSLSGGLDSSSILATTCSLLAGAPVPHCFTAEFPGFEKDESQVAAGVAAEYRAPHFSVTMSANELAENLPRMAWHQEEPFSSASLYAQYRVYGLAAAQNVRVLLDGQGADETLAGYHKYYKWYWQELFRRRRLLSSGELRAARRNGVTERFGLSNMLASLFPDMASVFLEKQYLLHALRHPDLTPEFIRLQSKEAYYTTPVMADLNGVLHFNTCLHGLEELLRYADRNAMAHGCEVRLPFLSHHLVEFVFSLPASFKIRQGWTKWILRQAMEDRLPQPITWRREKVGFEPPQEYWMKERRLQELIHAARSKLVQEKILRPALLGRDVRPVAAYSGQNADWKYLSAGLFLGL